MALAPLSIAAEYTFDQGRRVMFTEVMRLRRNPRSYSRKVHILEHETNP